MHMAEDMELLRQYADHDSQEAFQILLERHVNLVYSTALRQVGDSTLAEEVTQTTFIILARKAGALGRGVILSGWLYRTTRFASMHARRTETRRKKWEQEAASMQKEEPNLIWEELRPLLDEAMAQLGEVDRNALVLRFFENKSARDVGVALGINEDAAQKQLGRAVERLRGLCQKRGLAVSAIALTALISANAVQAAPAGVVTGAAAAVHGAGGAATMPALVKGTLALLRWGKIKAAITAAVGASAIAGAVAIVEWPVLTQPHYEGRALEKWMAALDNGKRESDTEFEWRSWQEIAANRTAEQRQAAEAINAIGPAALPYLQSALLKEEGNLEKLRDKMGLGIRPDARRRRATLALHELGPAAKPLIPQLTGWLYGSNCPKQAAMVLASIGPEGWEVLTQAIPTTNNFAASPCSIWALATHKAAAPGAIEALKNLVVSRTKDGMDAEAAWALAELSPDHSELVPLYASGLKADREDFRWACALSLGILGPDARDAVPALVEALHDAVPQVRHDAAQALQEIDPEAAARAGVGEKPVERHVPHSSF